MIHLESNDKPIVITMAMLLFVAMGSLSLLAASFSDVTKAWSHAYTTRQDIEARGTLAALLPTVVPLELTATALVDKPNAKKTASAQAAANESVSPLQTTTEVVTSYSQIVFAFGGVLAVLLLFAIFSRNTRRSF